MIEVLIQYIRDKGYIVDVLPNTLIVRKYIGEELFSLGWGIFKEDLRPELEEWLYWKASRKLEELEAFIKESLNENRK